ncbi:excinuclease ABC subunit C, partial [bacterium]|nr:excinuclease ABC subunit C [bacterium]
GYDISNIFGKIAVGSMVVFEEGEPNKNEYRKFKIKEEKERKGDIAMFKEVLERRFKNKWKTPNLIIIDGGKAQLNIGLKILEKNNLNIPIISVSKGDGLRSSKAPDKIFFPGQSKPLELPLASPALHIVKRVRDEAHRFAINYHRQLKRKRFKKQYEQI